MSARAILDAALAGRRLDGVFVLDCHGHLGPWKPMAGVRSDAESMLERMDRIGIDMLCINAWNCPDLVAANDTVAAALRRRPERFVGFAATQPALGTAATLAELDRCFDELGFRGIKVHNGYEMLPMRDQWSLGGFWETVEAIWAYAARRRAPLLCHWSVPVQVLERYPDARFIIAHSLGVREYADRYAPYPNAYFDTASSLTLRGNLEYFIRKVGVERILYGSDMPYAEPAYRLGQVVGTRVGDEELERILGLNMARLLGIEPATARESRGRGGRGA